MATFSIDEIMTTGLRAMIETEAEKLRRVIAAWEAVHLRKHGCVTPAEMESARRRLDSRDYPPTPFGEWLQAEDAALLGIDAPLPTGDA